MSNGQPVIQDDRTQYMGTNEKQHIGWVQSCEIYGLQLLTASVLGENEFDNAL